MHFLNGSDTKVFSHYRSSEWLKENKEKKHYFPLYPDIQAALTVIGRRSKKYKTNDKLLDLTNSHFCKFDFQNGDFSKIDFSNSDLRSAILTGVDLTLSNLTNACLENADLKLSILKQTSFNSANLTNATIEDAILEQTIFQNANLTKANFKGTNVSKANWKLATVIDIKEFDDTYISNVFRKQTSNFVRVYPNIKYKYNKDMLKKRVIENWKNDILTLIDALAIIISNTKKKAKNNDLQYISFSLSFHFFINIRYRE